MSKADFFCYNAGVRLDVYLKTARLVKRRTVARELCDEGRVFVNGQQAKPGKDIKQGDAITLAFSSRVIDLEVLGLPVKPLSKTPPAGLFRIRSETKRSTEGSQWNEDPS